MQLKKIFLTLLGTAIAIQAIADTATHLTDPSKTIVVQKDQKELTLTLKSNRTTGYGWLLKSYDHNLLHLDSYQYIAPSSKLVGAPGAEQFNFTVKTVAFKAPQVSDIVLSYARPWDAASAKDTVIHWVTFNL